MGNVQIACTTSYLGISCIVVVEIIPGIVVSEGS